MTHWPGARVSFPRDSSSAALQPGDASHNSCVAIAWAEPEETRRAARCPPPVRPDRPASDRRCLVQPRASSSASLALSDLTLLRLAVRPFSRETVVIR